MTTSVSEKGWRFSSWKPFYRDLPRIAAALPYAIPRAESTPNFVAVAATLFGKEALRYIDSPSDPAHASLARTYCYGYIAAPRRRTPATDAAAELSIHGRSGQQALGHSTRND